MGVVDDLCAASLRCALLCLAMLGHLRRRPTHADGACEARSRQEEEDGFENRQEIKGLTSNPLTTLKILLSYCRRIKNLSKYETSRKTKI